MKCWIVLLAAALSAAAFHVAAAPSEPASADVRIRRLADYDATRLEINDRQRALVKKAQAFYAEIGKKLGLDDSGKGSGTDAAFAALSGKPVVVENFGLQGYGYHTPGCGVCGARLRGA
jgi:hypothetical protein